MLTKKSASTTRPSGILTNSARHLACTLTLGALTLTTAGTTFAGGPSFEATTLDTTLIFNGLVSNNDYEVWRTNGPNGEALLVKDINTAGHSNPANFTKAGSQVFFTATDTNFDTELWRTDGTEQGTQRVKDISLEGSIVMRSPVEVGEELYFSISLTGGAVDDFNEQLWKTDGTEEGTVLVYSSPSNMFSQIQQLTNVNGTLFFTLNDDNGEIALFKSDGTTEGTVLVKQFDPAGPSNIYGLFGGGDILFFLVHGSPAGPQLWISDGTEDGTSMLNENGPQSFNSPFIHYSDEHLFFSRFSNSMEDLYVSDGTIAGTSLVKDINPGFGAAPGILGSLNGTVYFSATVGDIDENGNGTQDTELWKTDGTEAGTVLVKDINPTGQSFPRRGFVTNDTFYFLADDGVTGIGLWKTDGTEQGTVKVYDINTQVPNGMHVAGGILYYATGGGAAEVVHWIDLNDNDMDGIVNATDNCSLHSNADQRDTDGDGFGNRCDPDFNNDGVINFLDIPTLTDNFLQPHDDADLNGDGVVNFLDYSILTGMFLDAPGPGAVTQ